MVNALLSCLAFVLSGLLLMFLSVCEAAESGPRAYANAPMGLNVLQLVYSGSEARGSRHVKSDAAALYYYKYFNFLDKPTLIGGYIPYANVHVSIPTLGVDIAHKGMGDPTLVIGTLFSGAPALNRKDFRGYHQDMIVGGSLQISMPYGDYDGSRALNIGANRWRMKSEVAVSQAIKGFIWDFFTHYSYYSDNKNYRSVLVKKQAGMWGVDTHLSYTLVRGAWVSLDYFKTWGGETTVDGIQQNNSVQDSKLGMTVKMAVSPSISIQGKYRKDIVTQSGKKTRTLKLKLQYIW